MNNLNLNICSGQIYTVDKDCGRKWPHDHIQRFLPLTLYVFQLKSMMICDNVYFVNFTDDTMKYIEFFNGRNLYSLAKPTDYDNFQYVITVKQRWLGADKMERFFYCRKASKYFPFFRRTLEGCWLQVDDKHRCRNYDELLWKIIPLMTTYLHAFSVVITFLRNFLWQIEGIWYQDPCETVSWTILYFNFAFITRNNPMEKCLFPTSHHKWSDHINCEIVKMMVRETGCGLVMS